MLIRHDWTIEELNALYALSLIELIAQAGTVHSHYHRLGEIQVCSLISIKTGGCPEDCKYCAQSMRYQTSISPQPMMSHEEVLLKAKKAISEGATRICLGAAYREVRDGPQFDAILRMVKAIADLRVEVCCTLGMLKEPQAKRLKEAGLYAYNHNLDSSEQFYKTVVTTRTYHDRLKTLDVVQQTALSVCCGGIIGMGESPLDRLMLILTLSKRTPHPDSVPINLLSPIPGTPFEHQPKISSWELVRLIAVARVVLPKTMLRLSAGRIALSYETQALCFLAGANSIHSGEKLLTVANTPIDRDAEMFQLLGLKKRPAFYEKIE